VIRFGEHKQREEANKLVLEREKTMVAKREARKLLEQVAAKAEVLGMHAMNVFEVDGVILYPDHHGWTTASATGTHDTLEDALRYLAARRIVEERSPGYFRTVG
jgi:hypothetical protein